MFWNETIIAIIFRLVNFAVLIALFIYLFKKYALLTITNRVAQKEALLQALYNQQQLLEKQQYALDKHVDQEAALCAELKEKVSRWKDLIDQKIVMREQERVNHIELLEKKTKYHVKSYAVSIANKRILTASGQQAQQSLVKQFVDKKVGQDFIQPIIDFMRKDIE